MSKLTFEFKKRFFRRLSRLNSGEHKIDVGVVNGILLKIIFTTRWERNISSSQAVLVSGQKTSKEPSSSYNYWKEY